jgi:hypothetical protein
VGRRKNTYPPDLKKKRCVGVMGGLAGQVNVSYQSKSDRFDTGKPSLTAEFNPTNPLEQGLGVRFFLSFFCPFFVEKISQTSPPNASTV